MTRRVLVAGRLLLFAVWQIDFDIGERHIPLGLPVVAAACQPFVG